MAVSGSVPGTPSIGAEPMNTPILQRNPTGHFRVPLATHRLAGKVALITGGGGKIGIETAARLIREGANVTLLDISFDALEKAVEALKDAIYTGEITSSRILTVVGDATVEADVSDAIRRTLRMYKKLDIAFLNAGISYEATSLLDTTEEDYERIMKSNVKSGTSYPELCPIQLPLNDTPRLTPGRQLSSASSTQVRR